MASLRLSGLWLERAGFKAGSRVAVQIESRRLVLEVIDTQGTGSGGGSG